MVFVQHNNSIYYFGCNYLNCCPHLYCGILQPSSGASCLSEHRNHSTRENSQTLKMISQVESFLCPDKQGTPEKGQRIQRLNVVSTYHNKDEDYSLKNHKQNNTSPASSQKFKHTIVFMSTIRTPFYYVTETH